MLKESKADIFVDPVLHTACALDLKHHCAAINPGRGRRECSFVCFYCILHSTFTPLKITFASLHTLFLTKCSVSQFKCIVNSISCCLIHDA